MLRKHETLLKNIAYRPQAAWLIFAPAWLISAQDVSEYFNISTGSLGVSYGPGKQRISLLNLNITVFLFVKQFFSSARVTGPNKLNKSFLLTLTENLIQDRLESDSTNR